MSGKEGPGPVPLFARKMMIKKELNLLKNEENTCLGGPLFDKITPGKNDPRILSGRSQGAGIFL
jgi:hypothetical protein